MQHDCRGSNESQLLRRKAEDERRTLSRAVRPVYRGFLYSWARPDSASNRNDNVAAVLAASAPAPALACLLIEFNVV